MPQGYPDWDMSEQLGGRIGRELYGLVSYTLDPGPGSQFRLSDAAKDAGSRLNATSGRLVQLRRGSATCSALPANYARARWQLG